MRISFYKFRFVLCLCLFYFLVTNLFAKQTSKNSTSSKNSSTKVEEYKNPSFRPLFTAEEQLGYTPKDILTADEVFKLSLLFSECPLDSKEAQIALQKFELIKKGVTTKEFTKMSEEERGRAVLKFLYKDTLKKYSLNQSKVDVVFKNGEYNCVSSALIYMAAAKAAGLDVRGVKTPLHAFCSVYVLAKGSKGAGAGTNAGKTRIDVETTNPYGFNPGSKETIENENNIKRYYVVPKKHYSNRQEVSDKVFTGLVAGNLCSDYIKSGNYIKAVPLGAARFNLVIDENSSVQKEVRNDFDILPCNYISIRPKSAEKYYNMLAWFTEFVDFWGNDDYIQKSIDPAFNNLFVLCYEEKNYDLAKDSYEKIGPYASKNQRAKAEEILADLFLTSKIEGLSSREQIKTINEIKNSVEFTPNQLQRVNVILENAWIQILNAHMKNKDFAAGYKDSLIAMEQVPSSANFKKANQTFYSNCIAQVHNEFAKQANKRNYNQALKILNEGLKNYPNDKTLTKDMTELKKVMKK